MGQADRLGAQEGPADDAHERREALEELRKLLVGPERETLHELQKRVEEKQILPADVSRVLVEAVLLRTRQDDQLSSALAPTIEGAIATSVRKNPKPLIDAIFPIIMPAIRKAIATALATMVEGMNHALESSFSVQGLKWRLEAKRTGKSYAEVALLHGIVYRVEQVFLIHLESGLLLEHVEAPSVVGTDADMVSSMLTAIQDFVNDSFATEERGGLDQIELGGLHIEVVRGPHAVLAAVVRGQPPASFRERAQEVLERVHVSRAEDFAAFEGDDLPFKATAPLLEALLEEKLREKPQRKSAGWILSVAGALLAALIVYWFVSVEREERAWNDLVRALEREPGILVLASGARDGGYFVSGLKDPDARTPDDLARIKGIDPGRVEWSLEPFHSLDDAFVLARARRLLETPASIVLRLKDGTLVVSGPASHQWIERARQLAPALPGIRKLDDRELIDTDLDLLHAVVERLDGRSVHFDPGSAILAADGPGVESLKIEVELLEDAAQRADRFVRIDLFGSVSADELLSLGPELAEKRCGAVKRLFHEQELRATFLNDIVSEAGAADSIGSPRVVLGATLLEPESDALEGR